MKLTKKSRALLLIGVAAMLVMSGCGKAKIGYIDGDRIMKEAPQIQSLVEEGNAKLAEAEQKAEAELQKDQASMSAEEFQKAQQQQQQKMVGIQQQYATQLKQKVDAAVQTAVKDKKLDVVVDNEANSKIVITGGIDVTDDVVKNLQ